MAQPTIQKKVCLLGSYGVGKTSLVRRFVSSTFDDKYLVTIGVKIDKKVVRAGDQDVQFMLWDVAGAEEHFTIPTSYIRGASGYLLVIDGTRPETLSRALDLRSQVLNEVGDLPLIALLNKADLADAWKLDEAALAPLQALGVPVLRSSAKSGENVEKAFELLANAVMKSAPAAPAGPVASALPTGKPK